MNKIDSFRLGIAGFAATVATLTLAGCYTPAKSEAEIVAEREARYAARYPIQDPSRRILVDGKMDDWGRNVIATADGDFVYVRFMVVNQRPTALQHGGDTLQLLLDLDGNALTGQSRTSPTAAQGLGIDVEIQFSPASGDGKIKPGVAVNVLGNDGSSTPVSHADVDFHFAPTYASEWYEARISRHALGRLREPVVAGDVTGDEGEPMEVAAPTRLSTAGGGVFIITDARGEITGGSDQFSFQLPVLGDDGRSAISIPAKRGDVIRTMTYNVLKGSNVQNPAPFARMIKAVGPDIVLFQEWDGASGDDIARWMSSNVGGTWHAVSRPEQGVAIASRHEIIESDDEPLMVDGASYPVRYVGALVRTPIRDTVAASVHLKCCGFPGSSEDQRRMAEAQAIRNRMSGLMPAWTTVRVLAGDLNLVGTEEPLNIIRQGLDGDGSEMAVAFPIVLGDAAIYTWSDAGSNFSPGRLDFGLYGDANTDIINAFVLDPARLSDATLAEHGLERGDGQASDHRPVVMDLRPR